MLQYFSLVSQRRILNLNLKPCTNNNSSSVGALMTTAITTAFSVACQKS